MKKIFVINSRGKQEEFSSSGKILASDVLEERGGQFAKLKQEAETLFL